MIDYLTTILRSSFESHTYIYVTLISALLLYLANLFGSTITYKKEERILYGFILLSMIFPILFLANENQFVLMLISFLLFILVLIHCSKKFNLTNLDGFEGFITSFNFKWSLPIVLVFYSLFLAFFNPIFGTIYLFTIILFLIDVFYCFGSGNYDRNGTIYLKSNKKFKFKKFLITKFGIKIITFNDNKEISIMQSEISRIEYD